MVGFLKGVKFRTDCTQFIMDVASADKKQCVEFVEDYKDLFTSLQERGLEPETAVLIASTIIVQHMVDGDHESLRSFSNCIIERPLVMHLCSVAVSQSTDEDNTKKWSQALKHVQEEDELLIAELAKHNPELIEKLHDGDENLTKKPKAKKVVPPKPKAKKAISRKLEIAKDEEVTELDTKVTGNIKTILTPQRAYFNRNTRVEYLYGLGELIESDVIFMKFVDDNDSIGIQASNPSVISRIL